MTRPARRVIALALVGSGMVSASALAQRRRHGSATFETAPNAPYDGRFAFARLRYTSGPGGYYYYDLPPWAHGYGYDPLPDHGRAERNLMSIMNQISTLEPHIQDAEVLALDDPELSRYPLAYMAEAGYWTLTDREAEAFRAYLHKGGFVIFDDFRDPPRGGGGWKNFVYNMQRVIPGGRFVDMDVAHPIFHAFFEIESLDILPQAYDGGRPLVRGLFEDNDPSKRLMAIANYNTDVSEFWEFSGTGLAPVDQSNEAFKLGVNYVMYGLTH